MRTLLLAGLLAIGWTQAVRADVVFGLSNVSLGSGVGNTTPEGTLTGSFTTNDGLTALVSYSILASATTSFAGFTYTPATSTVTASILPGMFFQLDSNDLLNELRIGFTSPLTRSGPVTLSAFSYENEPSGGNRFVTGGTVEAASSVPEPASLALFGVGMVSLSLIRRSRAS